MAGRPTEFEREVRDTVVKSGLTGVAATVLAVTIFSPAGFGNWVGASLASGFGIDSTANAADNPYANLPAYPAPLSETELSAIRGQLVSTAASLEITRAATDAKIEHMRTLTLSDGMVTFTPSRANVAPAQPRLRLTLSDPATAVSDEAPVEAYVIEQSPVSASVAPVSYTVGATEPATQYRDPHLELADLLLAHEAT